MVFFPDFCPSTKFTKNAGDQWGSSSLLLPAGEFLGAAVGCWPVAGWEDGGFEEQLGRKGISGQGEISRVF